MSNELHKKYEVTCWESNKRHGVIKPFNTYSEVVKFLESLPMSKFDTVKVQQTIKLYSKGELLFSNQSRKKAIIICDVRYLTI